VSGKIASTAVTAAVAGLLASVVVVVTRPAAPTIDDERVRALGTQVAKLESELADQRLTQLAHATSTTSTTSAASAASAIRPASRSSSASNEAAHERAPALAHTGVQQPPLEDRLAREGRDARWSDREERAVANALDASEMPGTSVDGVECKQSGCIVTLKHENDVARATAVAWLMRSPRFSAGVLEEQGDATVARFDRAVLDHMD
jgi:hypothetical protein